MNETSVQELRRGLFRICVKIGDSTSKVETIELCGSQFGKKLTISYIENLNLDKERDKFKYNWVVTVKETSWNNLTSEDSQFSPESQVAQEMLTSQKQENKKKLIEKKSQNHSRLCKSEISRPIYIWFKAGKPMNHDYLLKKVDSCNWKTESSFNTHRDHLTLYVDFGTVTMSQRNMITEFAEMFNSQNRCDVHFQFNNGKTIGAHILILSARNPVFASMFQSGMLESQTRKVTITDIDEEVFRQLLIHLYSGIAPKIGEENIAQMLYAAADKYDIETLKSECIDVLLKKLDISNAIEMLLWSHLHFVPKLFEFAMKCLVQNRREICLRPKWLDFVKNHPVLSVLVTQRMVNLV
jgi:speckle-type POZ protein